MPYEKDSFDLVFMSTTVCFLADVNKVFAEIHRVLQNNCSLILGFIDKNSHLGMKYQKLAKSDSPFYSSANFVSPSEIISKLKHMGFKVVDTRQTLLPDDKSHFNPLSGYGKGAFVVIKAVKTKYEKL